MDPRAQLIRRLEERFRRLSSLLYDTRIPTEQLDAEIASVLDEKVHFSDPWQEGSGRGKYRLGAAGFHRMFRFDLEIQQLHVQLDEAGVHGRAIVDGVMHLKQFSPLLTYPLRTILIYEFTVTGWAAEGDPAFLIRDHQEMWSFGDMIAALPVTGWLYRNLFRRGFSYCFLLASKLSGLTR